MNTPHPPSHFVALGIVAALGLTIFAIAGCGPEPQVKRTESVETVPTDWKKLEGVPGKVNQFQFEGHTYLRFTFDRFHGCPVVHDPDCKCQKVQLKAEKTNKST